LSPWLSIYVWNISLHYCFVTTISLHYLYALMGSMSDTLHYTSTTVDPIEETCTCTREDCCTHQDRTGADYEQQRSQQWKQADDTQRATHRESVDANVWKVQVSVHEKVLSIIEYMRVISHWSYSPCSKWMASLSIKWQQLLHHLHHS
jgi:hypothetical protein